MLPDESVQVGDVADVMRLGVRELRALERRVLGLLGFRCEVGLDDVRALVPAYWDSLEM
jgi:hypothetical protein